MSQTDQATPDEKLLQDYYQALDAINTQHLKLVDAQQELTWYKSREQEAYKFARKFGCDDGMFFQNCENTHHKNTDRNRVETYFTRAYNISKTWDNLVDNYQKFRSDKNTETKNIKTSKKEKVQEIKSILELTLDQLKQEKEETENLLWQINQNLESLKTEKMLYFVSVVVFAVITTYLIVQIPMKPGRHFLIPALLTSVYFLIIFNGISIDEKNK